MFTGLIQALCRVKAAQKSAASMRLTIDLQKPVEQARIGDSIAVNGACLTISELNGSAATFDISSETLSKTTLGKLTAGKTVNIELSLRPTDRLGGHFVTGHIDGTASITAIERQGNFANITFTAGPELLEQMVQKGSVAVDGISLTIASMDSKTFTVAVIPETLKKTTLGSAKPGDIANIETDMIVKTIRKYLQNILPPQERLTAEHLRQLGF